MKKKDRLKIKKMAMSEQWNKLSQEHKYGFLNDFLAKNRLKQKDRKAVVDILLKK